MKNQDNYEVKKSVKNKRECIFLSLVLLYIGIAKKDAMSNDNDGSKEDEKHPQELFNEIKMQTTHNLFCPYCTENIIDDAELSEKRKKSLVMWFPIVFTFEFPFIYLLWFFNNTQGMHCFTLETV